MNTISSFKLDFDIWSITHAVHVLHVWYNPSILDILSKKINFHWCVFTFHPIVDNCVFMVKFHPFVILQLLRLIGGSTSSMFVSFGSFDNHYSFLLTLPFPLPHIFSIVPFIYPFLENFPYPSIAPNHSPLLWLVFFIVALTLYFPFEKLKSCVVLVIWSLQKMHTNWELKNQFNF